MYDSERINFPRLLQSSNAPGLYKREISQEPVDGNDFHQENACDDCVVVIHGQPSRDDRPGEGASHAKRGCSNGKYSYLDGAHV